MLEILTTILIGLTLLSPVFFWMYVLQSFPNLGIGRQQFFIGIGIGAITTLPLIYSDFWILGGLVDNIFFAFSYISESFLGLKIFISLFLFFLLIFIIGIGTLYFMKKKIVHPFLISFLGYTALIAMCSVLMYFVYYSLGSSSNGEVVISGDYVFQGFALIFGYYIIIALLEEGLKYFGNSQLTLLEDKSLYRTIGFACTIGLGFAFFENIFYVYNFLISSSSGDGLFQLVFFRSIFTVSLHILCAILLAGGLYLFQTIKSSKHRMFGALLGLGGGAILAHAMFDVALSYGYLGVIFLYVFALYISVVFVSSSE